MSIGVEDASDPGTEPTLMAAPSDTREIHPASWRYRLMRRLRRYRSLRGWGRLADLVAAPGAEGPFRVENDGLFFEGDISNFIERSIYLRGEYEEENVRLFLSRIPRSRRNVVLDVGANIGTHSVVFAKQFREVHSFEPNASLFERFRRNMELNRCENVHLHEVGLANDDVEKPFYSIAKKNPGLGTFSEIEQYDLPLQQIGSFRIVKGDDYLASLAVRAVDAIKIDVQGYEYEVLQGLQEVLRSNEPIVWFEYGPGTHERLTTNESIRALFPYEVKLVLIAPIEVGLVHKTELRDVGEDPELPIGDYLVIPASWPAS